MGSAPTAEYASEFFSGHDTGIAYLLVNGPQPAYMLTNVNFLTWRLHATVCNNFHAKNCKFDFTMTIETPLGNSNPNANPSLLGKNCRLMVILSPCPTTPYGVILAAKRILKRSPSPIRKRSAFGMNLAY